MLKCVDNWKELTKVEDNENYRIEVDGYSAWIISKKTGEHIEYLSTHTFYGGCYEWSSKLLQKYGFNVQLKNWDI